MVFSDETVVTPLMMLQWRKGNGKRSHMQRREVENECKILCGNGKTKKVLSRGGGRDITVSRSRHFQCLDEPRSLNRSASPSNGPKGDEDQ